MKYDYLLKGNNEDAADRYKDVEYGEIVKEPKFFNPLEKYTSITKDQVAGTLANRKEKEYLKELEKRKVAINVLVEKYKLTENDAEKFLKYDENADEKTIKSAEKYKRWCNYKRYFEDKIPAEKTKEVIMQLREKNGDMFPLKIDQKEWINPIKDISDVPDFIVAETVLKALENNFSRKMFRNCLKDNMFSKAEIERLDDYYDLVSDYDKKNYLKPFVKDCKRFGRDKGIRIEKYINERDERKEERHKELIELIVNYANGIKSEEKQYRINEEKYKQKAGEGRVFLWDYDIEMLECKNDDWYKKENNHDINYEDLLVLIKREADRTGNKKAEIDNFIKENFYNEFEEGKNIINKRDGTEFPNNSRYIGGVNEWYENFGEDKRERMIIKKENKVEMEMWDNVFKEYDEKNAVYLVRATRNLLKVLEKEREKEIEKKFNEYHKNKRVRNYKEKIKGKGNSR